MISFKINLVTALLLFFIIQLHAQNVNEDGFDSYMKQSGSDPNFKFQLNAGGQDENFFWYIDNGRVSGIECQERLSGIRVSYCGFIPGKGSYLHLSESSSTTTPRYDGFYLYKNKALTKIEELPSFRQGDLSISGITSGKFNPLPQGNDKIFNRVEISPKFAGDYKEWQHFLHCALDQSVLEKDQIGGKKLQVKLIFKVGLNGEPYDIGAGDVPSACPDCADAAIKILYKKVINSSGNNCDVQTSAKPYRQWIPAVQNGRNVISSLQITIPFGYEDDPQNKGIVGGKSQGKLEITHDNEPSESGIVNEPNKSEVENNDADNSTGAEALGFKSGKASVTARDGKYILTLLTDKSIHTVFRPLPRNTDTAMIRKYNDATGVNQGGWAEIAKDKNGNLSVSFFTFTDGNNIIISPMSFTDFKKVFYEPK